MKSTVGKSVRTVLDRPLSYSGTYYDTMDGIVLGQLFGPTILVWGQLDNAPKLNEKKVSELEREGLVGQFGVSIWESGRGERGRDIS